MIVLDKLLASMVYALTQNNISTIPISNLYTPLQQDFIQDCRTLIH
jgi:hypothetical protein